jgi:hypothetical protein
LLDNLLGFWSQVDLAALPPVFVLVLCRSVDSHLSAGVNVCASHDANLARTGSGQQLKPNHGRYMPGDPSDYRLHMSLWNWLNRGRLARLSTPPLERFDGKEFARNPSRDPLLADPPT